MMDTVDIVDIVVVVYNFVVFDNGVYLNMSSMNVVLGPM